MHGGSDGWVPRPRSGAQAARSRAYSRGRLRCLDGHAWLGAVDGEREEERDAAGAVGLRPHAPAVCLDDALADGEPQADSATAARRLCSASAVEALEHTGAFVIGEAGPLI